MAEATEEAGCCATSGAPNDAIEVPAAMEISIGVDGQRTIRSPIEGVWAKVGAARREIRWTSFVSGERC